jgi:predicted Zn-dependent protease
MIMAGGTASLDEMIKGTQRGILVTKLWYIREVDPQTLLLTGLTRDGTFFIENGKIKHPVKNFRFNESPVIMLNNLEALGKPERVLSTESDINYLVPPMKIRDFTFHQPVGRLCREDGGRVQRFFPTPKREAADASRIFLPRPDRNSRGVC